jgi:hypothetical protein
MNDVQLPQGRDDGAIIVDGLESPVASHTPSRFPRRMALRALFAALTIILLAAFVIAALPPLRGVALSVVFGPTPIPTATISSQAQRLYITSNLPWGATSLDGKPLAHLPSLQEKPLRLTRGHHVITFHAAPFLAQSCTVSLPATPGDTCLFGDVGAPALVINFQVSVDQLPPDQRAAIIASAQSALKAVQSTETIYPGETYAAGAAQATEQLRATLAFTLDTGNLADVQCPFDFQDCKLSGQDCHQLCSVSDKVPQGAADQVWSAYGLALPRWNITLPDGKPFAQNQPDGFGGAANREGLVRFAIRWDGSAWHVTVPLVPAASSNVAPDIGCASAQNTVDTSSIQSVPAVNDIPITWQYTPAPSRAQGCLVAATADFNATPPAKPYVPYLLYRFGSFLSVNAVAQQYWPDLPHADDHERSIAAQLGAHF